METIGGIMIFIGGLGGILWIPISQIYFNDLGKIDVLFGFLIFQILWIMGRTVILEKRVEKLEAKKRD